MTEVPGRPMSHPGALAHPERVIALLARTLRELHALPVHDCPFVRTLDVALLLARERLQAGVVDQGDFDEVRRGRNAADLLEELMRTRPAQEDLVVTHGDACLPKLFIAGNSLGGMLDVGSLGVADRHADLALAYRSLRDSLSAGHAEALLDAYGRKLVDRSKIEYFMLLDEFF